MDEKEIELRSSIVRNLFDQADEMFDIAKSIYEDLVKYKKKLEEEQEELEGEGA